MKKTLIVLTVLGALLSLLLLIAAAEKEEAEPYKIGAVFAITGPASWLGEPERNTVVMVAEMVNEEGGVNGVPIELVVEDSVGDETKTVNAVKKLINSDQVLAIIGPS